MEFHLEIPTEIQIRESRGLVKDIYDPASSVREPLSEYRTMLDLIHREPTLAVAFDIITEFATYRGYDFIRGTREERDRHRGLFESINFVQVLPNIIHTLCYYGDGFLELRKKDSKIVNELYVLETTEMRIQHDEHGRVAGYVQRPFNISGMTEEQILKKELEPGPDRPTMGIFFKPEEVIHFRMKWIGSQVYSYNPNEPISKVASTKLYAGNYLMNIFINMPPRYIALLAGVDHADFENAKTAFRDAKTNYKRTIAFARSNKPEAKLQIQKVEPPYDVQLIDVIKWLNKEILKITRVPRTWVEGEDTENRGVGESLNLPFEARIGFIHRVVLEPPINRQLVPAVNEKEAGSDERKDTGNPSSKDLKAVVLRFNQISRKAEKEILEALVQLNSMGLKREAMVNYLDDRGILGIDPDDFEEMRAPIPKDNFPSRKREDKAVDDMKQELDETGTSRKSAKKMRG